MTFQTCLTVVIFVFCIQKSLECPQTNTSCTDINTAEGFLFIHGCPKDSEIYVSINKTVVAHVRVLGKSETKYLKEVIIIGNDSVVTRTCQDLEIKCIDLGKRFVDENCWDYKVTDSFQPPSPPPPAAPSPHHFINGWAVGVAVFGAGFLISLIGLLWYFLKRNHHVDSTVSRFLQYLRCSCLRKEIDADDTTQSNGVIRLSDISTTDPGGSGESAIEQDTTLESVHVQSIDPTADGQAPPCFSLNRNSSKPAGNPGIPPTASGDVVFDGNGASNHRAMNSLGSLRDDPGGVNDNNGKAIVGIAEMHSGWTADRGPGDPGSEGQPLLSKQRAADPGFDMTGKAGALVYKHGFDPDQVSRCSTVPDTDVESTPNMSNYMNTDL